MQVTCIGSYSFDVAAIERWAGSQDSLKCFLFPTLRPGWFFQLVLKHRFSPRQWSVIEMALGDDGKVQLNSQGVCTPILLLPSSKPGMS